MKNLLVIFLKYILFWLAYFVLAKLIFILFNHQLTSALTITEIFGIFFRGVKMDLSIACYLMLLPGLLLSFSYLFSAKAITTILKIYTLMVLVGVTVLNVIDLGLYPHWGTRVGITAFNYVGDPKGIIANITWIDVLLALIISGFYYLSFMWLFKKFFRNGIQGLPLRRWYLTPVVLLITVSLIIPIRGGFRTSPMNLSSVSFSNKLYVNQSASNFLWNFVNTIERRKSYSNPCVYTSMEEAARKFQDTANQRIGSDSIFIYPKAGASPNVLLIVLESFSNKVIPFLGGQYGVCPNLDSICEGGLSFSSFYASGNRSDRGISAILGGYPSLLEMSIMRFPDKSDKLTLISSYFNQHDYQTAFYYGGDIDFYNLKSFVLQGGYNELISQDDFPTELQSMSKWGVPDDYLFKRVLDDIGREGQPFFKVVYTLSSHPPYDVPVQMVKGNTIEAKYLNSVAYTDSCLGRFIREFKETRHWENTLVVITADHGALEPGPSEIIEPATYRIPLVWTGGIVGEPTVFDQIGGQPDLLPTLIRQLGWERDPGLFGHDLFSSPSYAFYMLDSGWGYITDEGEYYYDQVSGRFKSFRQLNDKKPDFDFAKAYLQVLHEDFLSK